MPKSTNPWDNIIYVNGDVKNLGNIKNLGVTIVVVGKYSDSTTSSYSLDATGSPFSNIATVSQRSSIMCLSSDPQAVSLSTRQNTSPGLIYAINGGIDVTSANCSITGMLVSGGTGTNGGVNIHPAGYGSLTVNFDPNAATGGDLDLSSYSQINSTWVPDPNQSPWYWTDPPFGWCQLQ